MSRAFIGIGSNIEPAANVRAALHELARRTYLIGISTVYLTEALGDKQQPPYYNCVAEIRTGKLPHKLKFEVLRDIEDRLGRKRTEDKYAARTIDIDLIIYDDLVLNEKELKLPDPDILIRPFLAIPLHELAPDLILTGYGLCIRQIVAKLSGQGMQPLENYTHDLRNEFIRR